MTIEATTLQEEKLKCEVDYDKSEIEVQVEKGYAQKWGTRRTR